MSGFEVKQRIEAQLIEGATMGPEGARLRASFRQQAAEAAKSRILDDGTAPDEVGPEIVRIAPARGAAVTFAPARLVNVGTDGTAIVERGHNGRKALQVCDVFDEINRAIRKGGARAPFTPQQISAARAYADLTERHAAGGLTCSSAFRDDVAGADGDLDRTDRLLAMGRKLEQCHRAIGDQVAMPIRRRRPSKRGGATMMKFEITDRRLVDLVALQGKSLRGVLEAQGWSGNAQNLKAVYLALWAALERLARCF